MNQEKKDFWVAFLIWALIIVGFCIAMLSLSSGQQALPEDTLINNTLSITETGDEIVFINESTKENVTENNVTIQPKPTTSKKKHSRRVVISAPVKEQITSNYTLVEIDTNFHCWNCNETENTLTHDERKDYRIFIIKANTTSQELNKEIQKVNVHIWYWIFGIAVIMLVIGILIKAFGGNEDE